ncbi:hypothetical protein EON65_29850 [archaeon]|nr:MAG: hypothetical protein EON65_29850 [archaeon]
MPTFCAHETTCFVYVTLPEWSTDDLAAWFTELKMEMYITNLYSNRVDGKLFINLNEDEYVDMGKLKTSLLCVLVSFNCFIFC